MPALYPHLPGAIVFWRRLRELTQEELAQAAGLSVSEVKWLEKGRKRAPRFDTLEKACAGLQITIHELTAVAEDRALSLLHDRAAKMQAARRG